MLAAVLCTVGLLAPPAQSYRQRYPLPDLTVPNGWGVNIHFTEPKPGEMEKITAAGFKWVRMDFFWHQIEREKGKYDFSGYDTLMANLQKHGICPLFILDYGNDLYEKGSPRTPAAGEGRARSTSPDSPS